MSIVLENISKTYGAQLIVDRVNLQIEDGEFFVLLGPSGSGKSTILRIIAGLAQPDFGRLRIKGADVTYTPPQERGIGFVFQNYSIFPTMSVARNIEFGLKIRGIAASARARKREELLDLVGMAGFGARMPHQLSGGQQQRVALARALAYEPSVLLLDEPFGALDVKTRSTLRRSLKEIHQKLGVTTILVTHDQEEAFELADRIGVLARGRLLQIETAESVYREPASVTVASFVGTGTLLSGRASNGAAHFGNIKLPIPRELPYLEGDRIQLFFRPEQVRLCKDLSGEEGVVLGRGAVCENTFLGATRRVRVRLPRLPGTRQLSPPLPFGEIDWLLDCVASSTEEIHATEYWVTLEGWQLIRRPPPRFLVFDNLASDLHHLKTASWLAQKLNGTTTIFSVGKDQNRGAERRHALEERRDQTDLKAAEIQLRYGKTSDQILREQAENLYDLLIIGPKPVRKASGSPGPFGKALVKVLEESEIPLLFVPGEFRPIRRMLICTAAGEPGKNDVRFGGRLARRLAAEVALLHVVTERESSHAATAAEKHLKHGQTTLGSFDLQPTIRVRYSEAAVKGILTEAKEGDYDVIVMGGHGPHSSGFSSENDVTLQVLRGSDRPVLVVPEEEVIEYPVFAR